MSNWFVIISIIFFGFLLSLFLLLLALYKKKWWISLFILPVICLSLVSSYEYLVYDILEHGSNDINYFFENDQLQKYTEINDKLPYDNSYYILNNIDNTDFFNNNIIYLYRYDCEDCQQNSKIILKFLSENTEKNIYSAASRSNYGKELIKYFDENNIDIKYVPAIIYKKNDRIIVTEVTDEDNNIQWDKLESVIK